MLCIRPLLDPGCKTQLVRTLAWKTSPRALPCLSMSLGAAIHSILCPSKPSRWPLQNIEFPPPPPPLPHASPHSARNLHPEVQRLQSNCSFSSFLQSLRNAGIVLARRDASVCPRLRSSVAYTAQGPCVSSSAFQANPEP